MKIKALKSFSGSLSMAEGEVINCNRKDVINDLLAAGYIEEVKEEVAPVQPIIQPEGQGQSEENEIPEKQEQTLEKKKLGRKQKKDEDK